MAEKKQIENILHPGLGVLYFDKKTGLTAGLFLKVILTPVQRTKGVITSGDTEACNPSVLRLLPSRPE